MPVPAIRTIIPQTARNFGRFGDTADDPAADRYPDASPTSASSNWMSRQTSARPLAWKACSGDLPDREL